MKVLLHRQLGDVFRVGLSERSHTIKVIIKDIRASNFIDRIGKQINTGIRLIRINPTNPAVKPDTTKLITIQDITTIDKNEPNRIGGSHEKPQKGVLSINSCLLAQVSPPSTFFIGLIQFASP